ncbi:hypothetical protein [Campylobacter sp. 19-13652]|uniref:hypothetical protein n=1 Tax=Campylobacter sp. 19-13652 TaxID=2840180 RepID=UPI001C74F5EC|nr:hypothetical protein [Campylobacter sp. 19-13652]BCX79197.1 hypothetical protein LBC_06590 [Campylobacter sp. 19-13652]
MQQKSVRIVNFLHLSPEKYDKILEYRNQKYVREASLNTDIITKNQHENYLNLLKKQDLFFAFLITVDDKDYAVISLKKVNDDTFYIGDYLVNEVYKFEGGGVVNKFCTHYICEKLGAKFISYDILYTTTRNLRTGKMGEVVAHKENDSSFTQTTKLYSYNSLEILNSKQRKLFDKMYEIKECIL